MKLSQMILDEIDGATECRGRDGQLTEWAHYAEGLEDALAKYGYEKARRIGVVAMIGGKNKTAIRNATPPLFRDLLIGMALRRASSAGTRP